MHTREYPYELVDSQLIRPQPWQGNINSAVDGYHSKENPAGRPSQLRSSSSSYRRIHFDIPANRKASTPWPCDPRPPSWPSRPPSSSSSAWRRPSPPAPRSAGPRPQPAAPAWPDASWLEATRTPETPRTQTRSSAGASPSRGTSTADT